MLTLRTFAERAEPADELDRAGVIKAFEFTTELAWRSVQDLIKAMGYLERGPKLAFRAAIMGAVIVPEDEPKWRALLDDRNLAAHTYEPEWTEELVLRIRDAHLPALEWLTEELTRREPEPL